MDGSKNLKSVKYLFDPKVKKGYMKLAQDEEEKQPLIEKEKEDRKYDKGSFSSYGAEKDGYTRFH